MLPYITQEEEPGQDSTQDGSIKEEEITLIKALSVVKSQEKKSELNMMIDDWIYSHLDEEVKLLDAIETMKAPELNAAISKVAKVKSSSIIGSNRGSTLQEKMPTTQNVVVKGYESLRDREESKDFNPDE